MAVSARWRGLQDLFDHVPLDDNAKERLFDEMSRPDRLYHGVAHLETLWLRHRLYSARVGLATPEIDTLVACAIAYHDSVFDFLEIRQRGAFGRLLVGGQRTFRHPGQGS